VPYERCFLTPTGAGPFMPAEGTAVLENLAFDLAREASDPGRVTRTRPGRVVRSSLLSSYLITHVVNDYHP
jgi:hypothetical protein